MIYFSLSRDTMSWQLHRSIRFRGRKIIYWWTHSLDTNIQHCFQKKNKQFFTLIITTTVIKLAVALTYPRRLTMVISGMSISTVTLPSRHCLFYYTECLNLKENFTAFIFIIYSHHSKRITDFLRNDMNSSASRTRIIYKGIINCVYTIQISVFNMKYNYDKLIPSILLASSIHFTI